MIVADLHTHTSCSHGAATAEEMFAARKNAKLQFLAISEHSPLPSGFYCHLYNDGFSREFPLLMRKLQDMKSHGGLLVGLELDWTPTHYNHMRLLTDAWPFDHVLGSLHFIDGKSVGNPASWPVEMNTKSRFERFTAYFYEMACMCSSGLINIASHPDFIKLRVHNDFQAWLKTAAAEQAIAHALYAMTKHGVALEINTAGLRWPFQEFYPSSRILSLAHEIGVEITFGSDAHCVKDIASGFAEAEKWARSHGFDHYLVFFGRKAEPFSF